MKRVISPSVPKLQTFVEMFCANYRAAMLVELFAPPTWRHGTSNCAGVQTKYEDKNFRDSLALDFGI